MSTALSEFQDSIAGRVRAVAEGLDRFVAPDVGDASKRRADRLVVGWALGAGLVSIATASVLLPPVLGLPLTFAASSLAAVAALLVVVLVGWRVDARVSSTFLCLFAGTGASLAIWVAGGAVSPLVALLSAFLIEPALSGKGRYGLGLGASTAALALSAALALDAIVPQSGGQAVALQWLPVMLYASFVTARIVAVLSPKGARRIDGRFDLLAIDFAADGDVIEIEGDCRRILGMDAAWLRGDGMCQRLDRAQRVELRNAIRRVASGEAGESLAVRLSVADAQEGEEKPLLLRLDLRRADGGDIAVVALARRDERGEALERDLELAREDAASTSVAMSRMLATVSHEMRTPLNAIIGFSDILGHELHGPLVNAKQREHVEIVKQSGIHLLALVNTILDASKVGAGVRQLEAEHFSFAEIADAACAVTGFQAARKRIRIVSEGAGGIGEIAADRCGVQQILINLLTNAVKFTPENGTVELKARRDGDWLEFSVSDDGIGIDSEAMGRLCTPFSQIRNAMTREGEGAGLGLSLVKGLVELHGGRMSIESAPRQGTTVTIGLPVGEIGRALEQQAGKIVHLVQSGGSRDDAQDTLRKAG